VIRTIASFADITEMRNAQRAVRKLSTELLKLQDEERRRIGRELHDGLAQTVLAINLNLAQARQSIDRQDHASAGPLERARAMTQQMSREIRTLSYLLHPPLLDDLGLLSALKEYVQGFTERSGIETQLQVVSEFGRLPQAVELALFRVVQESLGNIQRHSGSASAIVRLGYQDSAVSLEIIDFGRGMVFPSNNHPNLKEPRLGVGIPGMRERVAQLGGHLRINTSSKGTTVQVTLPVAKSADMETNDAAAAHPYRG
jgi:two-component system NarL family sensor kinase